MVCHLQGGQGGGESMSKVVSASYEARTFGIKNGMRHVDQVLPQLESELIFVASLQQVRKLCPTIMKMPYGDTSLVSPLCGTNLTL